MFCCVGKNKWTSPNKQCDLPVSVPGLQKRIDLGKPLRFYHWVLQPDLYAQLEELHPEVFFPKKCKQSRPSMFLGFFFEISCSEQFVRSSDFVCSP